MKVGWKWESSEHEIIMGKEGTALMPNDHQWLERHYFLLIFDFQTCWCLCIEEITEVSLCYILSGHWLSMHILYTLNLNTQKAFTNTAVGDDQDCATGGEGKLEISEQNTALILLVTVA